jgi:hypothetical protein
MAVQFKPVLISEDWHKALQFMAVSRTGKVGTKVSMREMLEYALQRAYGTLEEIAEKRRLFTDPSDRARTADEEYRVLVHDGDVDGLWNKIVTAVILHPETNAYVDEIPLDLTVDDGPAHYPIRKLAYYLRTCMRHGHKVTSLEELVQAYRLGK